jgi:hypothetical protein
MAIPDNPAGTGDTYPAGRMRPIEQSFVLLLLVVAVIVAL